MRFDMRVATFILVIVAMAGAAAARAAGRAEEAVEAFHHALESGDRAGALAVLSDDVRIFEQGWVEQSKAEYANHHLDSDIAFSKAVTEATTSVDVSVDGSMAVVMRQGTSKGTFEAKTVDSIGLETMVLHKRGDVWKIVHIHWSSRKAGK